MRLNFFLLFISVLAVFSSVQAAEVSMLPNYSMTYSTDTSASKETIWALWADVENWKDFDERLAYSRLEDGHEFGLGAIGFLKAKVGPKTKFKIIKFDQGLSFTETLYLPFGNTVDLQRYFEDNDSDGFITFTHEVNFKGPLRSVMYLILCGAFKKDLKLVVEELKMIAESRENI